MWTELPSGIKAVFFDLDGTLLPMVLEDFIRAYFGLLARKMAPHGYEPKALIDGIWAGIAAMTANDGRRSNEAVFWDRFAQLLGERVRADEPLLREFYENEFNGAQAACGFEPMAAELVGELKARGFRLALATNPFFPAVGTRNRLRWAGLKAEDFETISTYENSSYSKPNPAYYRQLLERLDLRPEETLMVGNDADEDLPARQLGMPVFLLTPCLINKSGVDLSSVPHGDFPALRDSLRRLPDP